MSVTVTPRATSRLFPARCDILARSVTQDDYGQEEETYAVRHSNIPCAFSAGAGLDEQRTGTGTFEESERLVCLLGDWGSIQLTDLVQRGEDEWDIRGIGRDDYNAVTNLRIEARNP